MGVAFMRLQKVCLGLLVSAVLAAGPGSAKQGEQSDGPGGETQVSSQDLKGGFGKPEAITGTITMVKAEEGIVVLAVHGSSQAPSTIVVVHSKSVHDGDAVSGKKT
jgi:hypothetical protein